MSAPLDDQLTQDLRAGQEQAGLAHLAQAECLAACKAGDWLTAEDARNRTVAHIEASLDAFVRAYKRLEQGRGG